MYETSNISTGMADSGIFQQFSRTYTRLITPGRSSLLLERKAKSLLQEGRTYQISAKYLK